MSALTEEGVAGVKTTACERLLAARVELKVAGKRIGDVLNRCALRQRQRGGGGGRDGAWSKWLLCG